MGFKLVSHVTYKQKTRLCANGRSIKAAHTGPPVSRPLACGTRFEDAYVYVFLYVFRGKTASVRISVLMYDARNIILWKQDRKKKNKFRKTPADCKTHTHDDLRGVCIVFNAILRSCAMFVKSFNVVFRLEDFFVIGFSLFLFNI